MQAIAKQRDDYELQYLLSRSVRNSHGASGLKAHSFRSFAYRSSASLQPAQRALGFVMSSVKRFEALSLIQRRHPRYLVRNPKSG